MIHRVASCLAMSPVLYLALLTHLASPQVARADGAYFVDPALADLAYSGGQQAILAYFEGREVLVLQTEYEGQLGDFSWIVPVPSTITLDDVGEAGPELFPWLDGLTAPSFHSRSYGDDPAGCTCSRQYSLSGDGAVNGDAMDFSTTEVVGTIDTETFTIELLDSESADDLEDWLVDNGYGIPEGTHDVFDHYIEKGWRFLGVQIRPMEQETASLLAPPPIRVVFDTPIPVFPLRISTVSSKNSAELLIHVLAYERAEVANVELAYADAYAHSCWMSSWGYQGEYLSCLRGWAGEADGEICFMEHAGYLEREQRDRLYDMLGFTLAPPTRPIFVTRYRSFFFPGSFNDDLEFRVHGGTEIYEANIAVHADVSGPRRRQESVRPRRARPDHGALAFAACVLLWRRRSRMASSSSDVDV